MFEEERWKAKLNEMGKVDRLNWQNCWQQEKHAYLRSDLLQAYKERIFDSPAVLAEDNFISESVVSGRGGMGEGRDGGLNKIRAI